MNHKRMTSLKDGQSKYAALIQTAISSGSITPEEARDLTAKRLSPRSAAIFKALEAAARRAREQSGDEGYGIAAGIFHRQACGYRKQLLSGPIELVTNQGNGNLSSKSGKLDSVELGSDGLGRAAAAILSATCRALGVEATLDLAAEGKITTPEAAVFMETTQAVGRTMARASGNAAYAEAAAWLKRNLEIV